jgi:signal transduction histidine kinase
MLRAIANAVGTEPDAPKRLAEVMLDAPSLGKVRVVTVASTSSSLPPRLSTAQIDSALRGTEVVSAPYLADLAPAMDVCVRGGRAGVAVCTTLDLLELQRQVQRIRVGDHGYALAFDHDGRLLAAGAGALRAAVLSGSPVAESSLAAAFQRGTAPAKRLRNDTGTDLLAGWASIPGLGWSIAVEQPADEALRGARTALALLAISAAVALSICIVAGYALARRMLATLELEERFRTAGRIAAGVTHDLGHRLTVLQQIETFAATNDPDYLPRIRDALATEVGTLRRFVTDFSDLTREAKPADFLPIELNALAESIRGAALPYATEANVALDVQRAPAQVWVKGDRYLLERAALNLARNAIEASQPGSCVHLRVVANDRATLMVEDEGSGIPPDRIPTLFDSFSSTKRTGAHVGMGLPNVRRIVVAHGGTVSVKSAPGRGSTFTIFLPPAQSSSPSAPAAMP